ncbi:16S rRNA (guanine(966)-N(2))-methyltransferase RsmD [Bartonella tamiae]|uniref:RsmD family RNA methyltransferase n=1 Tax=Bartonella tamiae Th239 TaxID=1094558 RepID=J1K065_9HYPH|nr:16S rRNA (guanine(966)-N(2))-methyltransferase RsmD [Bartonella tamiae]EJF90792.1 RsmD family RNA methyltransferase [Bartonella tamiae Th239]EJF93423.1 RsmD family RNA methyltransferase [Bartonella tamiae Th307]
MRIVAGKYSGRSLVTPSGDAIRPTTDRTRESLFNILASRQNNFWHNRRVLDLFSGTGALGIEALSRGAEAAVFVEHSVEGRALIHKNIEAIGLQGVARILRRDATRLGPIGTMKPFDSVFADPPYNRGLAEKALISALEGGWLLPNTTLIIEESCEASLNLPEIFFLDDVRHYGGTIIRIYTLKDDQ